MTGILLLLGEAAGNSSECRAGFPPPAAHNSGLTLLCPEPVLAPTHQMPGTHTFDTTKMPPDAATVPCVSGKITPWRTTGVGDALAVRVLLGQENISDLPFTPVG